MFYTLVTFQLAQIGQILSKIALTLGIGKTRKAPFTLSDCECKGKTAKQLLYNQIWRRQTPQKISRSLSQSFSVNGS